ncbi:MAG: sensor histidine kinase [Lachnospiraceae bacterium]
MRIYLPAIIYAVVFFIGHKGNTAEGIVQMMCLLLLSAGIYGVEALVDNYIEAKSRIAYAVTITSVNEMYQKKLNQELRLKNYLIDKNARLEERENISRNIHNSVGHSITAAIMTLDAADMLFEREPEQAREKMHIAKGRIREGLENIRHAVRVLDTENTSIAIIDFIKELQDIIHNFVMDTQIKVRADFPEEKKEQPLPHEHTEFLTGALQELLTNGVKHGKADFFVVSVVVDSSHIRLCVSDNGNSFLHKGIKKQRIEQGYGLKKIISYTKRCGGTTHITEDNGWMTEITLPLEGGENNA